MKLSEYIKSRRSTNYDNLKYYHMRLYVPTDMQNVFGLGEYVDVPYKPSLYDILIYDTIFTMDMATYLELDQDVYDKIVGLSINNIILLSLEAKSLPKCAELWNSMVDKNPNYNNIHNTWNALHDNKELWDELSASNENLNLNYHINTVVMSEKHFVIRSYIK